MLRVGEYSGAAVGDGLAGVSLFHIVRSLGLMKSSSIKYSSMRGLGDDGTTGFSDASETSERVSSPMSDHCADIPSSERGEEGAIDESVADDRYALPTGNEKGCGASWSANPSRTALAVATTR